MSNDIEWFSFVEFLSRAIDVGRYCTPRRDSGQRIWRLSISFLASASDTCFAHEELAPHFLHQCGHSTAFLSLSPQIFLKCYLSASNVSFSSIVNGFSDFVFSRAWFSWFACVIRASSSTQTNATAAFWGALRTVMKCQHTLKFGNSWGLLMNRNPMVFRCWSPKIVRWLSEDCIRSETYRTAHDQIHF